MKIIFSILVLTERKKNLKPVGFVYVKIGFGRIILAVIWPLKGNVLAIVAFGLD